MARPHDPGGMLHDCPLLPLVPHTFQAPHQRREDSAVLPRYLPEGLLRGLPSLGGAGGIRGRPESGGNQESLASNVHVGYSAKLPVGAAGGRPIRSSPFVRPPSGSQREEPSSGRVWTSMLPAGQ